MSHWPIDHCQYGTSHRLSRRSILLQTWSTIASRRSIDSPFVVTTLADPTCNNRVLCKNQLSPTRRDTLKVTFLVKSITHLPTAQLFHISCTLRKELILYTWNTTLAFTTVRKRRKPTKVPVRALNWKKFHSAYRERSLATKKYLFNDVTPSMRKYCAQMRAFKRDK